MRNPECDTLGEPERRLCRGDVSISEYIAWVRKGVIPVKWNEQPILAEDTQPLIEDLLLCPHRGEETGEEISGLTCSCDKRVFTCALYGKCSNAKTLIGGFLSDGTKITHDNVDSKAPKMCRSCSILQHLHESL